MSKFLRIFCIAATLAVLMPMCLAGNIVVNGSFETPVAGKGSFLIFNTGSSFTGWTVVGAPGDVAIIDGSFTQFGFTFPAQSGNQWLDLTGLSNSATGVQQTLATVAGQTYNLSFWVGNIFDPSGLFGTSSTVDVFVNGNFLLAATNSQNGGSSLIWQQFTSSFVASSGSTTITFLNGDPGTDNNNGLDNIVITGNGTTPVPEPSNLLLLGTGVLGAMGGLWRKLRV